MELWRCTKEEGAHQKIPFEITNLHVTYEPRGQLRPILSIEGEDATKVSLHSMCLLQSLLSALNPN